jgi:hypothetical protein
MSATLLGPRSAYSAATASAVAAAQLCEQLLAGTGSEPRCILFFAALAHDGNILGQRLQAQFPQAQIVGCSSNGEFTDGGFGKGGVAALALYDDTVGQVATALLPQRPSIEAGVEQAAGRLGQQLGRPLRKLDPQRYVGIALLEGASSSEERVNEALGNQAPLLPFIGGSAGDNITFSGTWVFAEGRVERDAGALMVLELLRPFAVLKTCNFVATAVELVITQAEPERRLILEIDGQPAAQRYAALIGAEAETLGFADFLAHPLGLLIDGQPWLRSCFRREGSGLLVACAVLPGMTLNLMQATDLVADTQSALARTAEQLGAPPRAALLFNCAYRMLEAQIKGLELPYHQVLRSVVHAGLHSNGESYLGHINQTLTGLVIA